MHSSQISDIRACRLGGIPIVQSQAAEFFLWLWEANTSRQSPAPPEILCCGNLCTTALVILALSPPCQLLPLYQR